MKSLKSRFKALKEQKQLYESEKLNPNPLYSDSVKVALGKKFENCYECLWKAMRFYFKENQKKPNIPNSPKAIFEMASQYGLWDLSKEQREMYIDARINFHP